jgi:hypothetical protein
MIEKVNAVVAEALQEELLIMIILEIHLCKKDQSKIIRHNKTLVIYNSRRSKINKNKYNEDKL